jgi:allantoicase
MVRLGVPGIVRGIVVDTAFFTGNYPPEISVEGAAVEGYPSPQELLGGTWLSLVERSAVQGDMLNPFPVTCDRRVTHVKLTLYPDGGVARLRVHGDVVADPRFMSVGSVDLAAMQNGGSVIGCSNMFYSLPTNLIAPGEAHQMSEGWETSRRRDDSNDWVELALAGPGTIRLAELDTRHFVGNAPGWARLTGTDARMHDLADPNGWVELLARERLQPDTPHRFILGRAEEVTHVRLDVYPDGGMARLRLWGDLSDEGREALRWRWFESLPEHQAREILKTRDGTRPSSPTWPLPHIV